MSLRLSEEQEELRSTLRKFVAAEVSSEYLRSRMQSTEENDSLLWKKLHEMGLCQSFASEEHDGLGLGMIELGLVSYESGFGLLPVHLALNALCGPYALSQLLAKKNASEWGSSFDQSKVMSGETLLSGLVVPTGAITIQKNKASGGCSLVPAGAELVMIEERGSGRCCIVPMTDKNSTIQAALDPTLPWRELQLNKTEALPVVLERSLAEYIAVLDAAHLAGIAERMVQMTVDYVKERRQFGVPVGGFQAVQHQMADMHLRAESMRTLSHFAAWAADHSREQFGLAASSAIQYSCRHAGEVVEAAIQLHGGIGFTWEHDLHLYLRRVRTLVALHSELGWAESTLEQAV